MNIDVKDLFESILKQVHAYVSPYLISIDKRLSDTEERIKQIPAEGPDIDAAVREAVAKIPAAKDGADGANGKDGINGKDGVDGIHGKDGTDGKDGADADPVAIAKAVSGAIESLKVSPEVLSALVNDGIEKALPGAVQKSIDSIMPEIVAKAAMAVPAPTNGKDGADGESVSFESVVDMVSKAVSLIPAPRDGIDGKDAPVIDIDSVVDVVVKKIPTPKDGENGRDGKDVDPELIRLEISKAVDQIPRPAAGRDGRDATVDLEAIVKTVVAMIPAPKDGKDGIDGQNGKDGSSVIEENVIKALSPIAKNAAMETASVAMSAIVIPESVKSQADHDGELFLKEFTETIQAWGASVP